MNRFLIEHIDPLGQGVHKDNGKVYFIPKTLPGESGSFQILRSKKGVHFCELTDLDTSSPDRINPACPHFSACSSCHFLHTTYEQEIAFKLSSFQRLLRKLEVGKIEVITAPDRLHYRNRIQLHYDEKNLGFIQSHRNQIFSVPNCKIFEPNIQKSFDLLQQNWKQERQRMGQPKRGHIEIYLKDEQVNLAWNKSYSDGGFTQVNQIMNKKIQALFRDLFNPIDGALLELFGGEGNLSHNIDYQQRICVDFYQNPKPDQVSLDLFKADSLDKFIQHTQRDFQTLFIDPPRSGFKNIHQWVNHFKPETLAYLSCNPATQIRDIQELLPQYAIKKVYLIDLFPSTYHFESLIVLRKQIAEL